MDQIDEVISSKPGLKSIMKFFKLERAPENIPSVSVLIGSLYREIKISKATDETTNYNAQKLFAKIHTNEKIGNVFSNQQLISLFNSSLSVPKSTSQNKKDKFFLAPFISEIGSYGLAARNTKGSWNPGALIIEILINYSPNEDSFIVLIKNLFECLLNVENDQWAKIVSYEFKKINSNLGIDMNEQFDEDLFRKKYRDDKHYKELIKYSNQAKLCFQDLNIIIGLKDSLTRQKWIGIFEAYLRLTLFNHIIYTMNLSRTYISFIISKIESGDLVKEEDLYSFLDQSLSNKYILMDVSTQRTSYIENNVRKYCFYNTILDGVFEKLFGTRFEDFKDLNHFISISNEMIDIIRTKDIDLNEYILEFKKENEKMLDLISPVYPRNLKNTKECLEYLCQKKATSKSDASPDVNYIFDREFYSGNAPYKFDLSPGMISTLCCLIFSKLNDNQNFISGVEFIQRLKGYNINLSITDVSTGKIKNTMQSLGVIIDSPDNEGGVLILRPGWI
jgi:hypothetical protein